MIFNKVGFAIKEAVMELLNEEENL